MELDRDELRAYAEDRADSEQRRRIERALETSRNDVLELVEELYPVTNGDCLNWKAGECSDMIDHYVQAQLKFPGSTARRWNDDFVRRVEHFDQVNWEAAMGPDDAR